MAGSDDSAVPASDAPVPAATAQWPNENGRYTVQHWNGQLSLGISFWVSGVVIPFVAGIVIFFAMLIIGSTDSRTAAIVAILLLTLLGFAFQVGLAVGLWRSAENHKRYTGRKFWAIVVQILVVLGWLHFAYSIVTLPDRLGDLFARI
ncbi:MAG: hypothetical protein KIT16_22195 [Rhodospirillaceae bacterium]|nr:hypothetical protein [Rhodospirillaceae bacterium]